MSKRIEALEEAKSVVRILRHRGATIDNVDERVEQLSELIATLPQTKGNPEVGALRVVDSDSYFGGYGLGSGRQEAWNGSDWVPADEFYGAQYKAGAKCD